jgi:hypothetical protein
MSAKQKPTNLYVETIPPTRSDPAPERHRKRGVWEEKHKFAVGQTLHFSPSTFEGATGKGFYRVVRLLPAESGDNQYRLKSVSDGHERVVRESQLASG